MTRYLATLYGQEHELEVEELAPNSYRLRMGEQQFELDLQQVGANSFSILIGERSFDFDVFRDGDETLVVSRQGAIRVAVGEFLRHAPRRAAVEGPGGPIELRAMMPGRIVSVLVRAGDEVAANQGVVVVEAMKMENEVKSPRAGKVAELKVVAGQTVEKGELLAIIE